MPKTQTENLIASLSGIASGKNDPAALKTALAPLVLLAPDMARLQTALPSTGSVFVARPDKQSLGRAVLSGMASTRRIPGLGKLRLDKELANLALDKNGDVIHDSGSTTSPASGSTTSPAEAPAVTEGRNFALKLISLSWKVLPIPQGTYEVVELSPTDTKHLRDVLSDAAKLSGFQSALNASQSVVETKLNRDRWQQVFAVLSYPYIQRQANEAVDFGPYTVLQFILFNGVPLIGKRTDSTLVTHNLYSGILNPQPTDKEKLAAAGDAINAWVNATWHHDFFLSYAEMTHDQAQLFGKGLQVFGPYLKDIGTKLQQEAAAAAAAAKSSGDSDAETAKKIVGSILVVCGSIFSEVGKAILSTDHGNGIKLLTNFWAGVVLTGCVIVWPESR